MKKRLAKKFLEQLEKVPNISLACEKLGISRNTIYRWRNEDEEFNKSLNEAFDSGIASVNDLAESKLLSLIDKKNIRAIEYWLEHNNPRYAKPNLKEFRKEKSIPQPIDSIELYAYGEEKPFQRIELPKQPEPPPPNYP